VTQRADGTGEAQSLLNDGNENWPMSWSPDGSTVAYERRTKGGLLDLWAYSVGPGNTPNRVVGTEFSDESPRFSPDGRWLAWVSNHTGQYEVYVAPYPELDRRQQISSGSGVEPVWHPSGRELFYRQGWRVLSVPLTERNGVLRPGPSQVLFEGPYNLSRVGHAHYDVTPDGERFVMVEEDLKAFENLRLILDWNQELPQLLPQD
jgi:Tol biopolymer transport system component